MMPGQSRVTMKWAVPAAIIMLAVSLVVWGLAFGLPAVLTPDEPSVVDRALTMAHTGDLNPHYFTYPHLVFDVQALLDRVVLFVLNTWPGMTSVMPALQGTGAYYLAGRALSAACALGAMACAYGMGRNLDGTRATGILAAIYLGVAPLAVQHAHYATVDGPSAAATALCGYLCLLALRRAPRRGAAAGNSTAGQGPSLRRRYARRTLTMAAVAAGLAAGVKYNGALVIVCPLLSTAIIYARASGAAVLARRKPVLAVLGIASVAFVTYLVTTPFTVLDWADFRGGVLGVAIHYADTGHPGAEGEANWLWYLSYLCGPGFGLVLMLLAMAGTITGVLRRQGGRCVLVAFVGIYYALLAIGTVHFERNLLPILPFLVVLAAAGTHDLAMLATMLHKEVGRLVIVLVVVATISMGAATAIQQDVALTHTFTQSMAAQWIMAHVPAGATIAVENWEAPPLPVDRYHIVRVGALGRYTTQWYRGQGVGYIVADTWTDGAYFDESEKYAGIVANYDQLFSHATRVGAIHSGEQNVHEGPDYTIYRLQAGR